MGMAAMGAAAKPASRGLHHVPRMANFPQLISRLRGFGSRPAYKNRYRCWSYADLVFDVMSMSSSLSLGRGKFVRLEVDQPYYFCVAFLAAVCMGYVAVLGKGELGGDALKRDDSSNSDFGVGLCRLDTSAVLRMISGRHYALNAFEDFPETKADDPCAIAFSSGTTSVAKGVVLSQRNLLSDVWGGMSHYSFASEDRYLAVLPRTHLFGLVADMLAPLIAGGTMCFSDSPISFFDDLGLFQPTSLSLPPAIVSSMVGLVSSGASSARATGGALRRILCAGATVGDELISAMEGCTGVRVRPAYGLTECSPCVSLTQDWRRASDSVGTIIPCCEARVDDQEILVRGENVMLGYYHAPQETACVLREGWLHTGDLGRVDGEGNLFLTGRKTSLIVFEDGRKLMPEVLEDRICELDGIAEALVVPDVVGKRAGFRVVVTLEPATGANESRFEGAVRSTCRDAGFGSQLADVRISRERLPRTSLGKLVRRAGSW